MTAAQIAQESAALEAVRDKYRVGLLKLRRASPTFKAEAAQMRQFAAAANARFGAFARTYSLGLPINTESLSMLELIR